MHTLFCGVFLVMPSRIMSLALLTAKLQFHLHPAEHVFHYTGAAKVFFDYQNQKMSVRRASNPLVLFKVRYITQAWGKFHLKDYRTMNLALEHSPQLSRVIMLTSLAMHQVRQKSCLPGLMLDGFWIVPDIIIGTANTIKQT